MSHPKSPPPTFAEAAAAVLGLSARWAYPVTDTERYERLRAECIVALEANDGVRGLQALRALERFLGLPEDFFSREDREPGESLH